MALAEWVVIYDGLSDSNFPDSDLSGWSFREECDGGDNCSGSKTFTCDQNPNRFVKLDDNCNRWRRDFSVSFPYFRVKIVATLLFIQESDDDLDIYVEDNRVY